MTSFRVCPSTLESATVKVPGDKSISHRALMLGAIANGDTVVDGLLAGEDCLATWAALEAMGVTVERLGPSKIRIRGAGNDGLRAPQQSLDLGNSGTAMRLFAGLLAGQAFDSELIGDESLSSRPMQRVIDPLAVMGARIVSVGGHPPLNIVGGRALQGVDYVMPVASAQVKSAVLLAGLTAAGTTCVTEPAITRDHTERMLQAMGVELVTGGGRVCIAGGQRLNGIDVNVPGDLSSAAFLIVAALLAKRCELVIQNVGINPTRSGVIDILRAMGGDIRVENRREAGAEPTADLLVRSSALRGIDVDPELVSLAIDEFPVLFVAAAAADGSSHFSGLQELRVKESDRIGAMVNGLQQLGINAVERPDGADIEGGLFSGGEVDSRGDHRIAMAFAVAGTRADAAVTVARTDNVDTSYPGFVKALGGLGVDIEVLSG